MFSIFTYYVKTINFGMLAHNTLSELQQRISKMIEFLDTIKPVLSNEKEWPD
jgi:hypothetical protein